MTKLQFAWHIHHDVLLESLIEPFENRVKYIKESKPRGERKLRLRLFKTVKGELPFELVEVWKAWNEAGKARDEALKTYEPQILALHKKECRRCPWNGETIFSKK